MGFLVMSYTNVIDKIVGLPHSRTVHCADCGASQIFPVLQVHGKCSQCNSSMRLRGHGAIGTEIEDVVDAVLEWMGDAHTLQVVLDYQKEIVREVRKQESLEMNEDCSA